MVVVLLVCTNALLVMLCKVQYSTTREHEKFACDSKITNNLGV